ncbi:MAG: hypothetical protein J6J00_03375 [Treponema sp.]|nr:hypothetical protein [Treponema sp.]
MRLLQSFVLLSLLSLFIFVSCESQLSSYLDSDTESQTSTTTSSGTSSASSDYSVNANSSASWAYSASSPVYELSSSINSLTITGLSANQTIFLAKTNPTSSAISASKTQYISDATNLTLTTAEESSSESSGSSGSSGSSAGTFTSPGSGGPGHSHYIPVLLSDSTLKVSSSRAATSTSLDIEQINPVAGSTSKSIYIDADSSLSSYKSSTATLQAIGEYCYVWVVDDLSSDEEPSEATISTVAQKFDEMYSLIRNIFGNESDKIFYKYENSDFTRSDMENLSDTGTMINIVIYDIGDDHDNNDESGVLGYFYAKDYYPNSEHLSTLSNVSYSSSDARIYSNEGKYFYIDAYYTQNETDMMLSTLAHEFQHMIDWGVKYMDQGLSTSTEFNEMLSMLCEDLMQEYLGISDSDSPKGRLPMFEQCYTDCGLEYRSSSTYLQILSYAANYAFGSWIAREFGGASVISEMSQNEYVDTQAIVNAVNEVKGTSYSIEDLLKMYACACIIQDADSTYYTWPTFNQSTSTNSYSSNYDYPLSAINLWNLQETLSEFYEEVSESSSSAYYKFDGPELYGYNAQKDIRPYGMTLIEAGSVSSSDSQVTLTFGNTSPSSNEKVYVIVD